MTDEESRAYQRRWHAAKILTDPAYRERKAAIQARADRRKKEKRRALRTLQPGYLERQAHLERYRTDPEYKKECQRRRNAESKARRKRPVIPRCSALPGYMSGDGCICGKRISGCCRQARNAYMRAYMRVNKEYFSSKSAARQKRLSAQGAGVYATRKRRRLVAFLMEFQGNRCAYCRTPLEVGPGATVDHVHPVVAGGTSDTSNLVAACFTCNSAKADTPAEEFLEQLAQPCDYTPPGRHSDG